MITKIPPVDVNDPQRRSISERSFPSTFSFYKHLDLMAVISGLWLQVSIHMYSYHIVTKPAANYPEKKWCVQELTYVIYLSRLYLKQQPGIAFIAL